MYNLDFERAKKYALERLENELSPDLYYHSIHHTRDHVVPAAVRLASMEGIEGEDLLLLLTATYFHDLGFVEQYFDHEAVGVRIAEKVLPGFGYRPGQVQKILSMIMATKLPQSPKSLLGEVLTDADMDVLGREDFLQRNQDLRAETEIYGTPVSDEQWYTAQLIFLRAHRYFTKAAQSLREAKKQENIAFLADLLAKCRVPGR